MATIRSTLNQWRYAWAMAWLQRSAAPEHQRLKGNIQLTVWKTAEWALPFLQLLSGLLFVALAFHWLQGTGIRRVDVAMATIFSAMVPVTFWGVFYLVTDYRDSSQGRMMNKQQALLGAWLAQPFFLSNDVPKNSLAQRLVLLEQDPKQVIRLFLIEARCLQALLSGLTHNGMRKTALEAALPEAAKSTPPRARF